MPAERPRGVHLRGNPDRDFLLKLDLAALPLDVETNGVAFTVCDSFIKKFLGRGGIIVCGIALTNVEPSEKKTVEHLIIQTETLWNNLAKRGADRDLLIKNGMPFPAACCLVCPNVKKTVEKAFPVVSRCSQALNNFTV